MTDKAEYLQSLTKEISSGEQQAAELRTKEWNRLVEQYGEAVRLVGGSVEDYSNQCYRRKLYFCHKGWKRFAMEPTGGVGQRENPTAFWRYYGRETDGNGKPNPDFQSIKGNEESWISWLTTALEELKQAKETKG